MPTDDERREVARRLRDKHRERAKPNMFEPQDAGMQLWSYLKDLEDCLPDGDSAFIVLADLIEPSYDRDALLDLADRMEGYARFCKERSIQVGNNLVECYALRIREALGVQE